MTQGAEPISDAKRAGEFLLAWFGAPVDARMTALLMDVFKEVREDERRRIAL